ncbi:MAG: hypothetical protein HC915_01505 [Anaerolineae bacterium]|nr:hypothetical protein [Anaerolineae bacterium]
MRQLQVAVLGGVTLLALLGLGGLAALVAFFQQGADPASIFRGHQLLLPAAEQARWVGVQNTGRQPDPVEQEEILSAYWLAWQAFDRALQTGNAEDLPTYWTGSALEQVRAAVEAGPRLEQQHSGHQLRVRFFSQDGRVMALEDQGFVLRQTLDGQVVELRAAATVVFTQDNGFWRVRLLSLRYE